MKVEYEDAALCISRTFQGRYGQLYLNLDTTPVLGFISGILWLAELFRGSDFSTSTSPVRLPDPKFSMERRGRRNVIQPHNPLDLYVASYLLLMMSLGCKLCQFQRYTGFPLTRVYVTIWLSSPHAQREANLQLPAFLISGVHPAAYDLHKNHLEGLIQKLPPP